MKVVHISTSDKGGAFQSAYRLHLGLLEMGVDSKMLVLYQYRNDLKEVYRFLERTTWLQRIKYSLGYRLLSSRKRLLLGRKKEVQFTFPDTAYIISDHPLVKRSDVVHLHWVANFLDHSSLSRLRKPLVWTLHDKQPFSGGFHYEAYQNNNPEYQELDAWVKQKKEKVFAKVPIMYVVSPSDWLSKLSKQSSLFRRFPHFVIPYGLPLEIYRPIPKDEARAFLDLQKNKKVIVAVAESFEDVRKGGVSLVEMLKLLPQDKYVLLKVGEGVLPELAMEQKSLGFVQDEKVMAMALAAGDVFVITSLEDNFPNTVLEALACGTPVAGFAVGGISEMVQNGKNGMLVEKGNHQLLANAVTNLLDSTAQLEQMSVNARQIAVSKYSLDEQARQYRKVYDKIAK